MLEHCLFHDVDVFDLMISVKYLSLRCCVILKKEICAYGSYVADYVCHRRMLLRCWKVVALYILKFYVACCVSRYHSVL